MDLRERGQMTPEEERAHWWIRTRFVYLERSLEGLSAPVRILEAGCGTAQNLRHLREHPRLAARIGQLTGLEPGLDEDAVREEWMGPSDAIHRTPTSLSPPYDLLVAMDVLEHIEDDAAALREWLGLLRAGGRVFVTVPAFQSLWSVHDERLGHVRRYTRASLQALALRAGLVPERVRYAFGPMTPAVYAVRRLLPPRADRRGTDLEPTHPLLNAVLCAVGRAEARLGGNPWLGTSVVGYFHKPVAAAQEAASPDGAKEAAS